MIRMAAIMRETFRQRGPHWFHKSGPAWICSTEPRVGLPIRGQAPRLDERQQHACHLTCN